jgi:L-methionine (R)-S-oxide reductase
MARGAPRSANRQPSMQTTISTYEFTDKAAGYRRLSADLQALLAGEHDLIANAANTAALLFAALPEVNWAGFYFLRNGALIVGPFQGKPACVRIALGRGACGTAAAGRHTLVVADVHEFPDHIACDAESRAEIVVPLLRGGELLGVLDIDSPRRGRFDGADAAGLEALAAVFVAASDAAVPGA